MDRVQQIHERLFNKDFMEKKEWWGKDESILTTEEMKNLPLIIRKAFATEYTLRYMPIHINPDELIVGSLIMASQGGGREFPQYAFPEEKAEGAKSSFTEKSVWGHNPPDYEVVLNLGIRGLKDVIRQRLNEELSKDIPDTEAVYLFQAMMICLSGICDFANRFARLACELAVEATDFERKKELLEIARICSSIPELPPKTFQEALQAHCFIFCALHNSMEIVPIGRVDQYLYPFYKKDLDEGRIDNSYAEALVASWLAKFSERIMLNPDHFEMTHANELDLRYGGDPNDGSSLINEDKEEYNYGTSSNNSMVNMILGGQTPEGKDATNRLTYLILDIWARLELVSPVCSVRFHEGSPAELYTKCAEILRDGSGEPAIYNDKPIIDGMLSYGIPIEDARNYSNDGCWETLIPGKTTLAFDHVELLQLLEYMYTSGWSLVRNKKEEDDYGDVLSYHTYDSFYQAFLGHIERRVEFIIANKMKYYRDRYKIAPSPLADALTYNCIEKGKDINLDGAYYNVFSVMLTGFSHAVDSLVAIKKLVYEEKSVTLEELVDAIKVNFQGHERLRYLLLNKAPKFGNDDSYADSVAVKLLKDVENITMRVSKTADTSVFRIALGVATFECYARFGHKIGASADGRLMSESIASNFSPSIGMDKNGLTAAIKSATKADLLKYYIGSPIDLQINKPDFSGREGLSRLEGVIRSFMDLEGNILTITPTSVEDMLAAQKNPEKYKNLRVRMGGLSAYFVALSKNHQDIMIERTKH